MHGNLFNFTKALAEKKCRNLGINPDDVAKVANPPGQSPALAGQITHAASIERSILIDFKERPFADE